MIIREILEEWTETLKMERTLAPRTIHSYYWKAWAALERVDELTPLKVKRAVNQVAEERGWCAGSVYQCVASVRAFLRFCIEQGYISGSFDIPYPKVPRKLPRPIPREHLVKFLGTPVKPYANSYATERDKVMFHLMLYCGLRVGEVAGLDCADCDLSGNILHVRLTKRDRERNIPLMSSLADELYEYLLLRVRFFPLKEDPALFVSSWRKRLSAEAVRVAFYRHLEVCGLQGYRYTPHSLRHSFATLLIEGGAEIRAIQELLGHQSIETTLLYTKVTSEHMRSEINKHPLADLIRGSPTLAPSNSHIVDLQ